MRELSQFTTHELVTEVQSRQRAKEESDLRRKKEKEFEDKLPKLSQEQKDFLNRKFKLNDNTYQSIRPECYAYLFDIKPKQIDEAIYLSNLP